MKLLRRFFMRMTLKQTRWWLSSLLLCIGLGATSALYAEPKLNGVAIQTALGKDQFIAGLYLENPTNSANTALLAKEPKRMEIRVLATQLSSRLFRRSWIEGMAINSSPAELEKHAENLATFSNMLKIKLVSGDVFSVMRNTGNVSVAVNGAELGTIPDSEFFDLLLRTWIGPVPPSSEFRANLLAQGNINPGPLGLFEATRPSTQRVASVTGAVAARVGADGATAGGGTDIAATTPQSTPVVEAPRVSQVAAATPRPQTVARATPKPTPTRRPTVRPTPTPAPKVALAPQQQELDESIFEDEDEEEFTAESILRQQLYYSQLTKYTHRFLQYPARAWDRGWEGSVRVMVTIDREGKVVEAKLLEESQHRSLNREAIDAVKRANPYPAMPSELPGDAYSFPFRATFRVPEQEKR